MLHCVRKETKSEVGSLLLRVEPGVTFDGLLTPWGQEEFTQFAYYNSPWDAFSLNVKQVLTLTPPVKLHIPESSKRAHLFLSSFCFAEDTEIRVAARDGRGEMVSLEQARGLLRIVDDDQWGRTPAPMLCLAMPGPVAHLLSRGCWKSCLLRASWLEGWRRRPLKAFFQTFQFPPQDWVHLLKSQKLMSTRFPMPSPSSAMHLPGATARTASWLRHNSQRLLDGLDEDDAEEKKFEMERVVQHLDAVSCQTGQKQLKYDAASLVKALLVAMMLRNKSQLGTVIVQALSILMPDLTDVEANSMLANRRVPSHSTISKRQLQLDGALCLFWKRRFVREEYVMFLWADSSPQAGHDFLLSIVQLIPKRQRVACLHAAQLLKTSVSALEDAAEHEDTAAVEELVFAES